MLLDSNILIQAANQTAPEIESLVVSGDNAVASITQIEVYGYTGLLPEEKAALDILFQRLTVFPLDEAVIWRAIGMRQNCRIRLGDAIIAATALVHELPLVTRNIDDFKHVEDLKLFDPFAPSA